MKTEQELLSNLDIEYYCQLLNIPLIGVLSKNLFNNMKLQSGCYILNLQDSDVGGGTHWTTLIITNTYAIYYDSFGGYIPTPILAFIKQNKSLKIIYSIDQIQYLDSIFCGWFCIYFCFFFTVLHKKCSNYKYLLNKHNSIFSLDNRHLNDRILRNLIKGIFQ